MPQPTSDFTGTGLRGSLRVSPQMFSLRGKSHDETLSRSEPQDQAGTGAKTSQPPYMTSVALLFPVEAATLFPIAHGIAGRSEMQLGAHGNAYMLAFLIFFIVLFIIALRYFATQDRGNGAPAKWEIGIAVASFLLWAGASGGYWIETGGFDSPIPPQLGNLVFAFLTIMWVALVPYAVRKGPSSEQTS